VKSAKVFLKDGAYSGATLADFTYDKLYNAYSDAINFIKENQSKFSEDLDETYTFSRYTTMTVNDFTYFLSVLLKGNKTDILSIYQSDSVFTKQLGNIQKRLDKFMASDPKDKNFKIKKYPMRADGNSIAFTVQDESYEFTDAEKTELQNVMRTSRNNTTSVLNYFR
jgi:hypothetical protein